MRKVSHLVLIASLSCAGARAEEARTRATTAPPATQPAVTTPAPASAAAPGVATPAALSQSKFLGALYAEISKRSAAVKGVGQGEVSASFHVNGTGAIDKVTITKASSPAHEALVKKILSEVQAPAAPGGGLDISQTFKFH
jgi:outer membrane biosynthesis protein TonB